MSKLIKLSDGTEVHMQEKFSHKAEKAFSDARDQGAVDREVLEEDPETGLQQLKVTRETPVANHGRAIEAALLVMVERVKKGESEQTPSQDWLDSLDENDYLAVSEAMLEVRRSGRERGRKSA
jgi:hypothetical protein